jgi:hypothetical protein
MSKEEKALERAAETKRKAAAAVSMAAAKLADARAVADEWKREYDRATAALRVANSDYVTATSCFYAAKK